MNLKLKVILNSPRIWNWNRKARKHGKKYIKFQNEDKHSPEFRNKFVLKRAKKLAKILNVEIEVIGKENISKAPLIFAPNHSSSFDPALIMLAMQDDVEGADKKFRMPLFLSKDDVKKSRKYKGYANLLDTFYIDRNNPREAVKEIDKMGEYGQKNKRYEVIFPEGTRSEDGTIGEFKAGAFRVAKKYFLPIIPVTINNALSISDTSRKGKLKVQVIFHKQMKPMSFITLETKQIAKNVKTIVESKWTKPEGERSQKEGKEI